MDFDEAWRADRHCISLDVITFWASLTPGKGRPKKINFYSNIYDPGACKIVTRKDQGDDFTGSNTPRNPMDMVPMDPKFSHSRYPHCNR